MMKLARWLSVEREASLHAEDSNPTLSSHSNRLFSLWPSSEDPEEGGPASLHWLPRALPFCPGAPSAFVAQGGLHPSSLGALQGRGGWHGLFRQHELLHLVHESLLPVVRVHPLGEDGLDPALEPGV